LEESSIFSKHNNLLFKVYQDNVGNLEELKLNFVGKSSKYKK